MRLALCCRDLFTFVQVEVVIIPTIDATASARRSEPRGDRVRRGDAERAGNAGYGEGGGEGRRNEFPQTVRAEARQGPARASRPKSRRHWTGSVPPNM